MLAIVNIDHVLANGGDLRSIPSHRGANLLYAALISQYHIVGLTSASEEIAQWWVRRERMPKWARIYAADVLANQMSDLEYQEWKLAQVRSFLGEGWEIAFYLDNRYGPIREVHELGVTVLEYEHATISPGWKDLAHSSPRSWEGLAILSEPGGASHGSD